MEHGMESGVKSNDRTCPSHRIRLCFAFMNWVVSMQIFPCGVKVAPCNASHTRTPSSPNHIHLHVHLTRPKISRETMVVVA